MGGRTTILHARGSGSLRHIWETNYGSPFVLEFFVDGEETPSIRGKLTDLIQAARKCEQPFVGKAGDIVEKRSNNLYLPVPFEKELRVDLIAESDPILLFMQLDYRVDDDSLNGVRLVQEGRGPQDMSLHYEGLENYRPVEIPSGEKKTHERVIAEESGEMVLDGPGIIRRLAVDKTPAEARLRVYFDGERTAAVNVDLADFMGPFNNTAFEDNACYLPMPFAKTARIELSGLTEPLKLTVDCESIEAVREDMGYFHAVSTQAEEPTTGYRPWLVLSTRGRGQWVGMSLYETGHDHGGGDFAIIDAHTEAPAYLHGINGEDYFSFAWFGKGLNTPYSEAVGNEAGRMRLHLENPYVFHDSIQTTWATLRNERPRGVSYWYQDGAEDLTLTADQTRGWTWEVFGPLPLLELTEDGGVPLKDMKELFAPLPSPEQIDAGEEFEVFRRLHGARADHPPHVDKAEQNGWFRQTAIGPHLNLSYIYRHSMDLGAKSQMGCEHRMMIARTRLHSPKDQTVRLRLTSDDPLVLELDGQSRIRFEQDQLRTRWQSDIISLPLKKGENPLRLWILDTVGVNMNWAGVSCEIIDAEESGVTVSP
jgi:hypothetical protein